MEETKKISLNYLRRISDNYDLTLEKAKELFPDYEVVDTNPSPAK